MTSKQIVFDLLASSGEFIVSVEVAVRFRMYTSFCFSGAQRMIALPIIYKWALIKKEMKCLLDQQR